MSLTVTDGIPDFLTIGDARAFLVTNSDYAAPDWTAQIVVRDSEGSRATLDATDSGTGHQFTFVNASLDGLKPGPAAVAIVFSDGTNRQTSDWQNIYLVANPTIAMSPTFAQQMVTGLKATILKLSGATNATVNFNGQSFTKADLARIRAELTYWESRVFREQSESYNATACRPLTGSIGTVFA